MHKQYQTILTWSKMITHVLKYCLRRGRSQWFYRRPPFSILFIPFLHFLSLSQLETVPKSNPWAKAICLQVVRRPGLDLRFLSSAETCCVFVFLCGPPSLAKLLGWMQVANRFDLDSRTTSFQLGFQDAHHEDGGQTVGIVTWVHCFSWARRVCLHLSSVFSEDIWFLCDSLLFRYLSELKPRKKITTYMGAFGHDLEKCSHLLCNTGSAAAPFIFCFESLVSSSFRSEWNEKVKHVKPTWSAGARNQWPGESMLNCAKRSKCFSDQSQSQYDAIWSIMRCWSRHAGTLMNRFYMT